jgi:hypothetical protein
LILHPIDKDKAGGIAFGNGEIMFLHFLEEIVVLEMFPALFFTDPDQGFVNGKNDQKCEIRADRPPGMQLLEPGKRVIDVPFEGLLLVGIPAVRVPVRDDEPSVFESGADQGGEVGSVIGSKKEGLANRISPLGYCPSHLVADPGGSRFPGKDRGEIAEERLERRD